MFKEHCADSCLKKRIVKKCLLLILIIFNGSIFSLIIGPSPFRFKDGLAAHLENNNATFRFTALYLTKYLYRATNQRIATFLYSPSLRILVDLWMKIPCFIVQKKQKRGIICKNNVCNIAISCLYIIFFLYLSMID